MSRDNTSLMQHIGLDVETCARWSCTLNSWAWPQDFPIKMPEGWDALPDKEKFKDFTFQLCCVGLASLAPQKELSRWHHLHILGKSEEDFEWWWEHRHDRVALGEKYIEENPELSDEDKASIRESINRRS